MFFEITNFKRFSFNQIGNFIQMRIPVSSTDAERWRRGDIYKFTLFVEQRKRIRKIMEIWTKNIRDTRKGKKFQDRINS